MKLTDFKESRLQAIRGLWKQQKTKTKLMKKKQLAWVILIRNSTHCTVKQTKFSKSSTKFSLYGISFTSSASCAGGGRQLSEWSVLLTSNQRYAKCTDDWGVQIAWWQLLLPCSSLQQPYRPVLASTDYYSPNLPAFHQLRVCLIGGNGERAR